MNLFNELSQAFRKHPDKTVFSIPGQSDWSFSELDTLSAQIGSVLQSRGLKCQDRILVQVQKSPQAIALYLACLRTGFVFVPLNSDYQGDELQYFVTDIQPSLIVTDSQWHSRFDNTVTLLTLNEDGTGSLTANTGDNAPVCEHAVVDENDTAVVIYTSGTTGRSKGAMLSNRNLLSNTRALMKRWRWNSDDVLLHALPVYHVHGLMISFHCAFLGGSTIRFLPSFDAEQVCHELANANVMMGVPTYYTRLLAQASLNRETCQHMRLFISGSAPLQEKTFAEFHRRTGHQILERYGMSETNVICSNPCDGARVPGTVGFPLDHVALRIVDDQQKSMPEGRAGDVQVRGPGVFSGYWRRPELLATEFTTDGYFRTGDVGSLDEEGRLTLSGRSKDLIITGGLNVYPAEIEAYIDQLEGVVESAVIGIPDDDLGERVVAIIVSGSEAQLSGDEIIARLREKLAGYKCPKKVFYRSELPRNTMGKIQKNQLRAWLTKELSRVKS